MNQLTAGEYGFLLLTSRLGNPDRKPLTPAQLRDLTTRVECHPGREPDRPVQARDFLSMGYEPRMAQHLADLLQEDALLQWYLNWAEKENAVPITRATEGYPLLMRKRLGNDSPGCLWARGDRKLLEKPTIALVGCRDLREENRRFAEEVGYQAAKQGLVLVSGNARGADKTAQNACLAAGGQVISVVADSLLDHTPRENLLYLSENSFDESFSSQRALRRNRVIHSLGRMVFVAQSNLEKGGTWDGTVNNLRKGYSNVACFRDGSEASARLEARGAFLVDAEDLRDLENLAQPEANFLL